MNCTYQPSWVEQQYYSNTMPDDHQACRLNIPVPEINRRLSSKGLEYPFDGMSSYLADQDKPYSHQLAEDFMMDVITAWPAYNEDHPCDPSSPEGSDLSSMLENDGFIQPPPPTRMLSRASSAQFSDPVPFTTFNSRSSTFIDAQLAGPAYQGSGFGYPPLSTGTLSHIQATPDEDLFKNEEGQYDFVDIKQDSNVDLLMMGQHPNYIPKYQNYSNDMTLDNPPAPTPNTTIKSEDDYDSSEPEIEERVDNESDTDYHPGGRKASGSRTSRRAMPRRNTVSTLSHRSRVTKPGPPRRKSSSSAAGNFMTAQVSKEHKHPCVFAFAGCTTLWKSKNEWKRHAMTQHLVLESYCCTLCKRDDSTTAHGGSAAASHAKGKGKSGKNTAWMMVDGQMGQVFNRKDLFTQHVKRMHEATFTKQWEKSGNQARDKKGFEDWIKIQQEEARFRTGREALNTSICPKPGCGYKFNGIKGWDDRLEHIWKHLDVEGTSDFDIGDGGMREWAVNNRIVVNLGDRLVLKDHVIEDTASDEDAPGDAEY